MSSEERETEINHLRQQITRLENEKLVIHEVSNKAHALLLMFTHYNYFLSVSLNETILKSYAVIL